MRTACRSSRTTTRTRSQELLSAHVNIGVNFCKAAIGSSPPPPLFKLRGFQASEPPLFATCNAYYAFGCMVQASIRRAAYKHGPASDLKSTGNEKSRTISHLKHVHEASLPLPLGVRSSESLQLHGGGHRPLTP